MMGAAAFAALTVMGAGLVEFPSTEALDTATTPADSEMTQAAKPGKAERRVRYVRLKPGQKAPRGAKVVREAAPTPRVVVRRIVTPAVNAPSSGATRAAARSRQSGG
jgi:hypothetical protein